MVPALKPLYDYAWFVGFFIAGGSYLALAPAPRIAALKPDTTTAGGVRLPASAVGYGEAEPKRGTRDSW